MDIFNGGRDAVSPITESFCEDVRKSNFINPSYYDKFGAKVGLRNPDGSGVMVGLTKVCSVQGYLMSDGERMPTDGKLIYRGVNMKDIVDACIKEDRFGFEEVIWLLLFGYLPTAEQLEDFKKLLAENRELPSGFTEDMIMKAPSPDIMNKLSRSVMALYSYDDNPDDTSIENVLNQSIRLIAQLPSIMVYAYQVKRRHYYKKSMYLHSLKPNLSTAESILHMLRFNTNFTDEEAKLLDLCLIIHAEHGGGNNSAFATRVLSSSGTDTYSAISAAIGSLKGPRHGGANLKVVEMLDYIKEGVENPDDEEQVVEFLRKIVRKEAGDGSGLIYGMGHAVYTLSDPRATILKENARRLAESHGYGQDFRILEMVEKHTPEILAQSGGEKRIICANVDLYSGLVYKVLGIPQDLFTPIFAIARIAGWCAHRMEELLTGRKIIRPAYKYVSPPKSYCPIADRASEYDTAHTSDYS
ncbi:MAG: citrate/2-methylcitrate synthase, partial [Clostridia bacterium]|nr:citrate/2-methylcitrate synthase [Clostridia bacterium]